MLFDEPLYVQDENAWVPLTNEPTLPPITVRPAASESDAVRKVVVDLSSAQEFDGLPSDARERFERETMWHELRVNEEISGVALAWIESGQVALMSHVSDTPGDILESNQLIPCRGTIAARVPLRLVCYSDSVRIATRPNDVAQRHLKAFPSIEDDLRAKADRSLALVGVTLGTLGDTFDSDMFRTMTRQLKCRRCGRGEIVVAKGRALPGLMILGVGSLYVVDMAGRVDSTLDVGATLFPREVIVMGFAPATVQAGLEGAVVLAARRETTQEMILAYPYLLEHLMLC